MYKLDFMFEFGMKQYISINYYQYMIIDYYKKKTSEKYILFGIKQSIKKGTMQTVYHSVYNILVYGHDVTMFGIISL